MSLLLKALLNGASFEEALEASGKAIREVASRKSKLSFKVTRHNGFISTEIYPELKTSSTADSASSSRLK